MNNIVHLKTRGETRMAAADEEVGRMLVGLANKYGVFLITTVVMSYVAETIVGAVRHGGPNERMWLKDLSRTFCRAMKGHNNTTPGTKT